MLAIMTVISAISLAAMLWLVNAAARAPAGGTVSGRGCC